MAGNRRMALGKGIPLHKNASTHVMLLVLRFYKRPVSFSDIREICPVKVTANNQRRCMGRLLAGGLAAHVDDGSGIDKFVITSRGIDRLYEIASPSK